MSIFILSSILYSSFNVSFLKNEFNLYLQKKGSDETQEFKYDQYYVTQTIIQLTKFISEAIKDPLFINPLFSRLGETYKKYKITIKEKNLGVVGVKILSRRKEFLEKIAEELRMETNNLLSNFKSGTDLVSYQVINSPSTINRNEGNFIFNIAVFSLIGFLCYIILILIKFAIKQEGLSPKNKL